MFHICNLESYKLYVYLAHSLLTVNLKTNITKKTRQTLKYYVRKKLTELKSKTNI